MSRNQSKRLRELEARVGCLTEVVTLYFADQSTIELKGRRNFVCRLLGRLSRDIDPCSEEGHQLDLIRQSVASREPDGAHLADMIRALLNSP